MNFSVQHSLKQKLRLGSHPDFMVVGAAKCGTTSLMKYCELYSKNFKPPLIKEPRYFTEFSNLPVSYYRANFPRKGNALTGEGTPDYLFYKKAPRLIKEYGHTNKFVVILRNPVERAYSQYTFQNYINKSQRSDYLSFSDAIRLYNKRYVDDENMRFYSEMKHFSYVERGFYSEQLKRWLDIFDRNQFHIMFLDDLKIDFDTEIARLFDFLGLERNNKELKPKIYNLSRNILYPDMSLADRKYLEGIYNSHNEDLFNLLNRDRLW